MADSERSRQTLTSALKALAEDEAGTGASRAVEVVLRQAVRAIGQTQRRRHRGTFLTAAAVLTAIVGGAWTLVVTHGPAVVDRPATREVATEFLPLTYADVPLSGGHLVRLEVPRTALIAFGLAGPDVFAQDRETVDAEVLVGDDGLARAVRFVHYVRNEE